MVQVGKNNKRWRLITISGAAGTGKSLLAKKLAKELNWPIFSISASQREHAKARGLSLGEVSKLPDEIHNQVDKEMIEIIESGSNMILESHLAGWQARKQKDVLKVLFVCDPTIKADRYSKRENISVKEAEKEFTQRDSTNLNKFSELYDAKDYLDPSHYNVIIDSSNQTVEEEVEKILKVFNQ